jgi:hypothetical protein
MISIVRQETAVSAELRLGGDDLFRAEGKTAAGRGIEQGPLKVLAIKGGFQE